MKSRILIVEDETIMALDIKSSLERFGYEVLEIVVTGEQAIQKAVEVKPDLVLMDVKLRGEMDGVEAAGEIHRRLGTPVIYLTAFDDDDILERARLTEPFAYILKPFSERELNNNIKIALYKAGIDEKLRESEKRYRLFHRAGQQLSRTLNLDEIYHTLCDLVSEIMDCDTLVVSAFDQNEGLIHCRYCRHEGVPLDVSEFPPIPLEPEGQGTQSLVIRSSKPLLVEDFRVQMEKADTKYEFDEEGNIEGLPDVPQDVPDDVDVIRSALIVPLIFEGQVVGVIQVLSYRLNVFTTHDLEIIESLAAQVAVAGNNAYLFGRVQAELAERRKAEGELTRKSRDLAILYDTSQSLLDHLETDTVYEKICRLAVEKFNFLMAWIGLLEKETATVRPGASSGITDGYLDEVRITYDDSSLGQGPTGTAIRTREPAIMNRIAADQAFAPWRDAAQKRGYHSSAAFPLLAEDEVTGVLNFYSEEEDYFSEENVQLIQSFANQVAIALEKVFLMNDLENTNLELAQAYNKTLEGWARALEMRDNETEGHSRRVTDMTLLLAAQFGIKDADLVNVQRGALLHDIGKMGTPDSILHKPGPLTDEEWEIMHEHPVAAFHLLSPIPYLKLALDIPYSHHEKWDGTGYPRGLKGEEIPLAARIFAIVDVWDALLSDRPYRKAWPERKVKDYLAEQSGKHFDPQVVKKFLQLLEKGGDLFRSIILG